MSDPLAEVVTLLQPQLAYAKVVQAAGAWRVRRNDLHQPFYAVVLQGRTTLTVDGHAPVALDQGDFVLVPASSGFTMASEDEAAADATANADADATVNMAPVAGADGTVRLGERHGPADVELLVGHCVFGAPDVSLLVSLLPSLLHVRDTGRLATLVRLIGDESRGALPGRDIVLARLLEVLLIEALRGSAQHTAAPGLLRGLADARLAVALRQMHEDIARPWTVADLAKGAALSRSTFFERFSQALGVAPMAYLLGWRMARAKTLLRQNDCSVATVAQQVGYGSASAFSVAFTRHVGQAPMRFANAPR